MSTIKDKIKNSYIQSPTRVGTDTAVESFVSNIAVSAYTQGGFERIRNPRSFSNTKTSSTTLTNIMTIRNRRIYNGYYNQIEIEPVFLSLSNNSNKNVLFQIRANSTVAGNTNFQDIGTNLIGEYETTGGAVTENGRFLAGFNVAPKSSIVISLEDFDIRIPPTLRLIVAARQVSSGKSGDLTATLTWYEDI